jgi:hypothetical protein
MREFSLRIRKDESDIVVKKPDKKGAISSLQMGPGTGGTRGPGGVQLQQSVERALLVKSVGEKYFEVVRGKCI